MMTTKRLSSAMAILAAIGLAIGACAPQVPRLPARPSVPAELVRANILALAKQEWLAFGGQTIRYAADRHEIIDPVAIWEDERKGIPLVAKYWRAMGADWSGKDSNKPWSAAFISWIMAEAGVPASEMPAAPAHAVYLRAAIAAPGSHWRARKPQDYAPRPGDLICAPRAGQEIAAFDAIPEDAKLHCDIVIEAGAGRLASIGGNVRNSVSLSQRKVDERGLLSADSGRRWFLVLENLYP
jgi:hypothetical protein